MSEKVYEKIEQDVGEFEMLIFKAIERKYYELVMSATYFKELYANDSRVSILNKSAPMLFTHIQRVLLYNIIMSISRLNDPAVVMGKANLSLSQLKGLNKRNSLPDLEEYIEEVKKSSKFTREWRNKIIGHNDLNETISDEESTIQNINYTQIEAAIKALHTLLNYISNTIAKTILAEGLSMRPEWNILFGSLVDSEVLETLTYDQSKGKEIPTLREARFTAQQQWE